MQKFKSEGPIQYEKYHFGYCQWLELEAQDNIDEAYQQGYLPYSGDHSDQRNLFYMARSLRVHLPEFRLDKSRRYDHRSWEKHGLLREHINRRNFLKKYGPIYQDRAQKWMAARFDRPYLTPERLDYILHKPFLDSILCWKHNNELQAFALLVTSQSSAHYWYCFYRFWHDDNSPAGHGFLTDFIFWAAEQDLEFAYLGTAYGSKSHYKIRGINGLQFWDGNEWNNDRNQLRMLFKSDT